MNNEANEKMSEFFEENKDLLKDQIERFSNAMNTLHSAIELQRLIIHILPNNHSQHEYCEKVLGKLLNAQSLFLPPREY